MRVTRVLAVAALGLTLSGTAASAQQWDDSFRWYVGGAGGVLGFETPSQTRAWVPTAGGQLLVVAKRTGLLVSIDQAFGSNELSGFADNTANAGVRDVQFDQIRRYTATLVGYPIRGHTQPYLGIGFGLIQVVDPKPQGFFTSPVAAATAKDQADQRSTDGFASLVAGVQFRIGQVMAFGQYQITTSAAAGHLLRGASHALTGGLRFSLGGAREGIRGGGY